MKEYCDINTELPYRESPDYVESLVRRSKEKAIDKEKCRKNYRAFAYYGLAGLVLAAAIAVIVILPAEVKENSQSPLDSFLYSASDIEIEMVDEWSLENISDSYYNRF